MDVQKDFDGWNVVKKSVNKRDPTSFYHEREVVWCLLGLNIGTEEDGSGSGFRRPVVILKRMSGSSCLVVPLTTSKRTHIFRLYIGKIKGRNACALLSQIRVVDIKRFGKKMGYLRIEMFEELRKSIKGML